MNKTVLKGIIMSCACVVAIGTEYALWQFNQDAEKSTTLGVTIATAHTSDGVVAHGFDKLQLSIGQNEIRLVNSDNSEVNLYATYEDIEGNDAAPKGMYLVYSISIDETLSKYIIFADGTTEIKGNWTSGTVISLPSFSWVENMKPTSEDLLTSMKDALNSGSHLTFVFELSDTPAAYQYTITFDNDGDGYGGSTENSDFPSTSNSYLLYKTDKGTNLVETNLQDDEKIILTNIKTIQFDIYINGYGSNVLYQDDIWICSAAIGDPNRFPPTSTVSEVITLPNKNVNFLFLTWMPQGANAHGGGAGGY